MISDTNRRINTPTDVAHTETAAVILKTGAEEALHVESTDDVSRELKTTVHGRIVLIPQPSDDPNDPLNWSWGKKHRVLAAVSIGALLADWGTAWGTTLFEAQAVTWNSSVPYAANSIGGAVFLTGVSGLLVAPLTQRYGRFQGLFASPPQIIGLSMIHDMFFFHERTRKIGIWGFCFVTGPFLGPVVSSLLNKRIS
ncbi:uncharacterized protein Z518_00271 [Rhinocladiella mackenziei CBS 650.93]|uniref:Major facilitator superfamily (MFS) profile domain-containing protein n=1 Tax=Rhinocladiella mackenziei CBS 650.93 TaxID=1442369 RepID=A0A0D2G3L7_9EURO|nr:uncharacterized protein Z518_00271 [Rhinocladiella mackenziei CBS 650.93]KIX09192.1 hypothetical protein Z518_00271 [Rhinocladiella mackenziei CBS 650.93]